MDIRPITDQYAASPQILAEDIPMIAQAGFRSILCNRPDAENMPDLQMTELRKVAEDNGLAWGENPYDQMTFSPTIVETQAQLIADLPGPVLAYCASGMRCAMVWALVQSGSMPTDEILAATQKAGYRLDHMRGMLG